MLNKKLILLVVISIFLMTLVRADLGTFKQGDCIELRTIINSTSVNLSSVSYPNGTVLYLNGAMTTNGKTFNYTFCNTDVLGTYIYDYYDIDNDEPYVNSFTISPTGIKQTTSQGIGSFGFLILMLGLTILMGYIGFKFTESDYLWIAGIFFLFLTILFVVYDVWLGYEYHKILTGLNDGSQMPEIIFWIFMFLLVASFVVTSIYMFSKWKKIKEWFKKGIEEQRREDEEDNREWN